MGLPNIHNRAISETSPSWKSPLGWCLIFSTFPLIVGCGLSEDSAGENFARTQEPAARQAPNLEGVPVPEPLQNGEAKFNAACARCHGAQGRGTVQGPPLVHKIYEPSHHGDGAFIRAATQGVRAHHWQFGNMPKIEGITVEEVGEIIKYVRWLQRHAGIH